MAFLCLRVRQLGQGLGPANERAECARMVTGATCTVCGNVSACRLEYQHWRGAVGLQDSMFRCQQLGRLGPTAAIGQPGCLSPASGGLQVVHAHFPLTMEGFIVISHKEGQDESLISAVYDFLSAVVSVCFDLHVHRGAHMCACPGYLCVYVPVGKLVLEAQSCSIFPPLQLPD